MPGQFLFEISDGGVVAEHPRSVRPYVHAAPTRIDDNERYNAICEHLSPIACWGLFDNRFEFDSSFIKTDAAKEFGYIDRVRKRYPGAVLSLFGHADPKGPEKYNRVLAARRAKAVYGVLTRNTEIWDRLYKHQAYADGASGDNWELQKVGAMMLASLDPPYGSTWTDIKQFQDDFQVDAKGERGELGPKTRKKLFELYMEILCPGVVLDPANDFLAGANLDIKDKEAWRGDIQTCGEMNPKVVFSKTKADYYMKHESKAAKERRNLDNAPNRRVGGFFFAAGIKVSPELWPCPAVNHEDGDAIKSFCKRRFWSDGDYRRTPRNPDGVEIPSDPADPAFDFGDRNYQDSHDTFSCRLYHRFSRYSPCEGGVKFWLIRFLQPGPGPTRARMPIRNEHYVVEGLQSDGPMEGVTDDNGIARILALNDERDFTVKIHNEKISFKTSAKETKPQAAEEPKTKDEMHLSTMRMSGGRLKRLQPDKDGLPVSAQDRRQGICQRLYNLGYGWGAPESWTDKMLQYAVDRFRKEEQLSIPPGTPADEPATVDRLQQVYTGLDTANDPNVPMMSAVEPEEGDEPAKS